MHKANSLKDLVTFYNKNLSKLSLLHHSIFLNKLASVANKYEGDDMDLEDAAKIMAKSAAYIFDNAKDLDLFSIAQSLKVIAYDKGKLSLDYKPSY